MQQTALFKFAKLCIVRHNEPNRTVECKILAICNNALYFMCVVLMVQCNVLSLILFLKLCIVDVCVHLVMQYGVRMYTTDILLQDTSMDVYDTAYIDL